MAGNRGVVNKRGPMPIPFNDTQQSENGARTLSGGGLKMENSQKPNQHGLTEEASLELRAEAPEPSVIDMSPAYPKYRDPLIKVIAVVIIVLILGGGFFFIKGKDLNIPIPDLKQNPLQFFTQLFLGDGTYQSCESFVRENRDLFEYLGESITLTPVRQEVRVVNRKKTARIIFRAKGSEGMGTLLFLLEKGKKGWGVVSVRSKTKGGDYRILYPRSKATSKNRV